MPNLNSSLNIGLTGLQASQAALNVVGHNISNVNTPGYSRQRVTLVNTASAQFGSIQFGAGVSLKNIMGVRDRFLDMQITESTSRQSGANTRYQGLEAISSVFNDTTDASLGNQIQAFFSAFSSLASQPEDQSLRTNLVGKAQSMVQGFQSKYKILEDQRSSSNKSIISDVQEVNTLTSQIAELNVRIAGNPNPGSDSDTLDQRQALVDKLASLVGIQVHEDDKSRLVITLKGGSGVLVNGTIAYSMTTTPDPTNSNYVSVGVQMGTGAPVDVTSTVSDGTIGANVDLRDNILAGYQSRLDQLAAGVVGNVNLLHNSGYALDGSTTGIDFFQAPAVSAATNYAGMVNGMAVNSAIVANPKLIAAAQANIPPTIPPASAGNNLNAKAIADLVNLVNTVDTNGDGTGDSGPFINYASSLVNSIGTDSQSFSSRSTNDENLITALQTQRDSISGVDLDEEAANLMAYQRGYQASARFINVINQLTDQLVNQFAT